MFLDRKWRNNAPFRLFFGKQQITKGGTLMQNQEAPDGCVGNTINLSTAAVDGIGWITESLPMRQVHGRAHWRKHMVHLDQSVLTFCAGSRLADGRVPRVDFCRDNGRVCVYASVARYADDYVRFRREVSRKS